MNQELLSFAIETLLMKPRTQVVPTMPIPGCPIVTVPQSPNWDVVRENAEEMRNLIVERLTSNAEAIADAVMSIIKFHAQMQPDVAFEVCDEVVKSYGPVQTYRVYSFDPRLGDALDAILSYCNYSFTPPAMNPSMMYNNPPTNPAAVYPNQSKDASTPYNGQYNDVMMSYVGQAHGLTNGLKMNVEALIQALLSSKMYSPIAELRNCNSKVVIIHDGPNKDELKSVAEEKGMIILTASTNYTRREVGLVLMINAYNSADVKNKFLFPKENRFSTRDLWSGISIYLDVEEYINTTRGMRGELANKAPKFLKDFDEELAIIHREYDL